MLDTATALYRRGEFDSVYALLEPELGRSRARNDSGSEARILTMLGLTARYEGNLATARELGEAALQLKLEIGLDSELSRSYNALGLVAWQEARREDALALFDKTLEFATDSSQQRTRAVVSINRGLIYQDLARFDEARAAFERGRDLGEDVGDARLVGAAVSNLAGLEIWTGDPGTAITTLQRALHYFDSLDIAPYTINSLGQMGTAYAALGEIGNAITVLDSAISFARDRGMRGEEASNLEVLAEVYLTSGDYRRALDVYAEAEIINSELGLVEETGADQRSRALIYSLLGDHGLALEHAHHALEIHEAVSARWEELADHVLLADLEHEVGNLAESAAHIRAARRIADECDARTARIDVALAEARIAERDREPMRVLRVLEAASGDLQAGGYDSEWEFEVLRSRAFRTLGEIDSAVAAAGRAVDAVEKVRAEAGSGMLRTAYGSRRSETYEILVAALLDRGEVEAAFDAVDRSRGRALLERLGTRYWDGAETSSGERDRHEAEQLLRLVGMLVEELRIEESFGPEQRDDAAVSDLATRLAEARSEYEALRVRSGEDGPNGLSLLGGESADAADVRNCLGQGEALLSYFVASDTLIGFATTRDRIEFFESPVSSDVLARRVRIARDVIGNPEMNLENARPVLSALHEVLLPPAIQDGLLAEISRLVVVPHGVLNYLPYAALLDPIDKRFLVEDYDIQVLPSAAALPVLRNSPSNGSRVVLQSAGGVAFAPFHRALPATRSEARAFEESLRSGEAQIGNRATEGRLRDALGQQQHIHIATHGVLNPRNPLFSRMDLAPGGGGSANDGRLEVHELLDIMIESPLVFLSGCETGIGVAGSTEFAQGEDYATLALAFLYAGASNVVSTLWAIEDEGAAAFAEHFYQNLGESGPVEALAATQRLMLEHEDYHAPFYWAGYQLAGAGNMGTTAQITGH